MESLAKQAAKHGYDGSSAALFVLVVRLRIDLGNLRAEVVALRLSLKPKFVSDVCKLLIFFVLPQGIEYLLLKTPVCLQLES